MTNRDCKHRKSRIVLVIFERASLGFLYLYFMSWFYLLFYIVTGLHSKMSERLRQGGRLKRKWGSSICLVRK